MPSHEYHHAPLILIEGWSSCQRPHICFTAEPLLPSLPSGGAWFSSHNARTIREHHEYFPDIGPLISPAGKVEGAMLYNFYDYCLDEARRELRRTGQLVAVEPKVFQVLLYL